MWKVDFLKIWLSVFLVLMLCQSCLARDSNRGYADMFNDISMKTAMEIEKEFPKLQLIGLGGSSDENVVKLKVLAFRVNGNLSKEQGIYLISRVVQAYLENVKSDDDLESYLKENKFDYNNLEISLLLFGLDGNRLFHPDYGFINLIDGRIIFQTVIKNEDGVSSVVSDERVPYEEAIQNLN